MADNPNIEKRHQPAKGRLVISGGNEISDGEVFREVATIAKRSRHPLLLISASSSDPERTEQAHKDVFGDLGVEDFRILRLDTREDALKEENIKLIDEVRVVFFTGGDQVRLVHKIGETPIFHKLDALYRDGGTLAGTSSGATALAETMIANGAGDESPELHSLDTAPGFGFLNGVLIDVHFAERGRIGRLCALVTANPKNLGIGIDEDTAVIVEDDNARFHIIGSGAVYILDGAGITYSSLSEDSRPDGILTVHGLVLHVLKAGDEFDLTERTPNPS